ncbi:MAG: DUF2612 domain-containing protein [Dehalococcoidia bacterium]|nr:MAG: DUF2612 domain-containing protein [Dehalococcoidia bacterium]
MTDEELIEYYVNLIILQYKRDKPEAHVRAYVKQLMIFELIQSVKNGYNLDTAVGKQLDVLGKYVGIDRQLSDGTTTTEMSDTDYRKYIKFKILKNFSSHSLKSVDDMLAAYFGESIKLEDNFDMSATYIVPDIDFAKTLYYENLFPKPLGVRLQVIVTPDVPFAYEGAVIGGGWGKVGEIEYEMTFDDGVSATFDDGESVTMKELDTETTGGDSTTGKWTGFLVYG